MGVEALVAGDDTVAEEPLLGVQDVSDAGSVGLGAHGEHVQLVEGGDLLQELAGVGPQPTVVDHRVAGQAKAVHILAAVRKKNHQNRHKTDLSDMSGQETSSLVPSPTLEEWIWLSVDSKLGQHYVSGPRAGPAMRLVDYSITSLNDCSIQTSILVATWTL